MAKQPNKKVFAQKVFEILLKEYPNARIELDFSSPFELLVATILSAQCTDERVNKVTSHLFILHRTPEEFAELEPEYLENLIFSTGYYKAKAKHIIESSKVILNTFSGEVPNNIDDLLKLPGVGRKTANVLLGHVFGKQAVVVDTHVGRLARRMGFCSSQNPDKVEQCLMEQFPEEQWTLLNHLFISHGRAVCSSRNPKCSTCMVGEICPKLV